MHQPDEQQWDNAAYAAAFAAVLRDLRTSLGLSQDELAHRSGYQRNYIGNLERGEKSPSLRTVVRLTLALGTTPAEMLALVEQMLVASN